MARASAHKDTNWAKGPRRSTGERERQVSVDYKGERFATVLRADLLVDGCAVGSEATGGAHSLRRAFVSLWLGACAALAAAVGCGGGPVAREQALGEAALGHAAALCAACPARVAGQGSVGAADWIAARLPREGTEIDRFGGAPGPMANVWHCRVGRPVALLVTHFDTKAGIAGFVGANDGASTTGLLLALANEGRLPVAYLFADGEECRVAYSGEDGLHGSWRAARSGRIPRGTPVIVLDMLGDAGFTPALAGNGSPWLNGVLRRAAAEVGVALGDAGEIIDDHVPFVAEGYRAADVIDFEYGPGNAWWHTARDTPDKLSAASLARAAALVRRAVELLEEERE